MTNKELKDKLKRASEVANQSRLSVTIDFAVRMANCNEADKFEPLLGEIDDVLKKEMKRGEKTDISKT